MVLIDRRLCSGCGRWQRAVEFTLTVNEQS
jgi:hypothetical protein